MIFTGQEFKDTVEKGRIFPNIRILASVIHITSTVKELTDAESGQGAYDEADFRKDTESSANAIGNVENRPARFFSQTVKQRFFIAAVVRVRNGYGFKGNAGVAHSFFQDHVVRHRFDCRARFRNDNGHYRIVRLRLAVIFQELNKPAIL